VPHRGVRVTTRVVDGSPAEKTVGEARRADARLVVVGSTTKSRAKRVLLGSVAHAVAAAATTSVLIVRGPSIVA
jgi:nucleotide-binding universal stress UspA family protein